VGTTSTTLLEAGDAGVETAVALLRSGECVGLPTETVYGLAADALDPSACARIFEAKARPLSDPLIVHLPDRAWADRLTGVGGIAGRLMDAFWPGPLTLVLPRGESVPDLVTAGQPTVALRMSAHPLFARVAGKFGRPLAAPSANRFGKISPTSARDVLAELGGRIPAVLDGGDCAHGLESTIVAVHGERLEILRSGPVTAGMLAEHGEIRADRGGIVAPGGLKSHYAPGTPLVLLDGPQPIAPHGGAGLLAWDSASPQGYAAVETLSTRGDLREAAARLYAAMRRLDAAGVGVIYAEPVPAEGLGVAILERLGKAAARE